MGERVFRSLDEIHRHYMPDTWEREFFARATPEELGDYIAEKAIAAAAPTTGDGGNR